MNMTEFFQPFISIVPSPHSFNPPLSEQKLSIPQTQPFLESLKVTNSSALVKKGILQGRNHFILFCTWCLGSPYAKGLYCVDNHNSSEGIKAFFG